MAAGGRAAQTSGDVVVIGAGLAGCCAALILARSGLRTTLIERDPAPMRRASLRNEGKIHLGLIYAAEAGAATARRQLQGALSFRAILRDVTGPAMDRLPIARPFAYLVDRQSLVTPDALAEHYALIERECAARLAADPAADYLGRRPDRLAWPLKLDAMARHFDPERFAAAFATSELAIDTDHLSELVAQRLRKEPTLELRCGHRCRAAERHGEGFRLEGDGPGGTWSIAARQVVNATWEQLYAIDDMVGLRPPGGWLHRLKYRVLVRLPEELERAAPSATMVLGAYGDVVVRPGGLSYLSWYPEGLQGWTAELTPPEDWDAPCRGDTPPDRAAAIADKVLAAIDAWMPGVRRSRVEQVDAGAILAHGRSDVDDPDSGLHSRMLSGVTSLGGWHSLNPGKLTTAPLHAREAAEAVLAHAGVKAAYVA